MALTSPGVQVSVIDESFYTPAEPGTRPLFIVASAQNKSNASGTGTAQGTLAANAGTVYTVTSQRELADLFGDPVFKVDTNNNPIHAGELNEYGLQAAYSFLGVSNSALVVRANVDLDALLPQAEAPAGAPEDGTFWLDTANTNYGIFEWDGRSASAGGQTFTNKLPAAVYSTLPTAVASDNGKYAVLVTGNVVSIYYKSKFAAEGAYVANGPGTWVKVGSNDWAAAWAIAASSEAVSAQDFDGNTVAGEITLTPLNGTPFSVDVSTATSLDQVVTAINSAAGASGVKARNVDSRLEIYVTDANIDEVQVTFNDAVTATALKMVSGNYAVPKLTVAPHTLVPTYKTTQDARPTGSVWLKTTEPNNGQRWRVKMYNANTQLWESLSAPVYSSNELATAGIDPTGAGANLTITSVYVKNSTTVGDFAVQRWNGTQWVEMLASAAYEIDGTAPVTLPEDGTLWYSSVVDDVDFMVLNVVDGKATWRGLNNHPDYEDAEVFVQASTPELTAPQKNVDKHLWVDTSDLEHYPNLKRWNKWTKKWVAVDTSDQTTENGILFADARWATTGGDAAAEYLASDIADLRTSDFVDFDAPDPALYPEGMLLWNLRRSGFNVKKFVRNYIDPTADNIRFEVDTGAGLSAESMANYYPHRWVTESGNQADGSGSFGRHAQRKVVIQALQALVNSNDEIRDTERNSFNLLACPGYPELIGEMVTLNYDRGLTAFVVGDSPARLTPDATSLNKWGTNVSLSLQDDDKGLVSYDEYLGVFYPWGFTSDNAGNDIAVPPSHMILRMIALNDQVAYPWFAPAGTRRGGITNATAVGYVTAEGEFKSVALNEGQRDTLYNVKVNPITFFVGAGLVNFGQKTRARNASAMDRINVARLVIHLRSQLNKLAKPYIFEPNDKITRDEIKQQVESLLLELVGQRALYDFLVVCDESNNTPNRIDRNELYVDIAIEPVKAVEFIYIPVRLKNTGEIAGLG